MPNLLELVPEAPVDPEVDETVEEATASGEPQGHKLHPLRDSFMCDGYKADVGERGETFLPQQKSFTSNQLFMFYTHCPKVKPTISRYFFNVSTT